MFVSVPAGVFAGNDLDTFSLLERPLDPDSVNLKKTSSEFSNATKLRYDEFKVSLSLKLIHT